MTMADVSVEMPNLGPDTEARWGRGFIVALSLHAAVLAFLVNWAVERVSPEAPPPAIMIDLAPTPPVPMPSQPEKQSVSAPEKSAVEPTPLTPLPIAEKPEVVLKKTKPARQKARSHPQVPKPENREEVRASAPAAPTLSASPIEAKPAVAPDYLSTLFAHLERYKRYPRVFGERNVDLVVLVHVEISRAGQVLSLAIKKSSGSETYDKAALSTFRRAEPLPSFPPSMAQATLLLDVPVRFKRSS